MRLFVSLALALVSFVPLQAATFTVTNTNDSGAGSLRQAITDANASGGADVIDFSIAAAGVQTITPVTQLPQITGPVTIDGYTQTGASANTLALGTDAVLLIELSGANGVATGLSFSSGASGSTIRGIAVNRFQSGITFNGTDNSTITGCYIGTDATGMIDRGNTNSGLFILNGADNNQIGGATPAERNVISGNNTGVNISTSGNTVIGNYIGPNAAGTAAVPGICGISFNSAGANTIGTAASPNVISGNAQGTLSSGIALDNPTSGVVIRGNLIGVAPDGTTSMPNGYGILFYDGFSGAPTNITIGGSSAGNVIASNTYDGIALTAFQNKYATGVRIDGNSIHSNGGLGIDHGDDGVTANDTLDGDTTFNNLQNFPTINHASALNGFLTVTGILRSAASKTYDVQLFHNTACDASGYGEGRTYLGAVTVSSDAAGDAPFQFNLASGITAGGVTAVAIETVSGDTSEFSSCVSVAQPAQPAVLIDDVSVTEGNAGTKLLTFTVSLTAAAGAGGVSVDWDTGSQSAAPPDYVAASGTLTIPEGAVSGTIAITINGDGTAEADETFIVTLDNPVGGTISDSSGVGTIVNDDNPPSITIADASIAEGNAGTTNLTFTVSVNPAPSFDVTVSYATAAGTATAGSDYTSAAGEVTITAGNTSNTFVVPLTGETVYEPNETFTVTIYDPVNGVVTDAQATGTITNDDGEPSVGINDPSVTEGNSGTKNITFTVTLSNPSYQNISVPFALVDGTATVGSDYVLNSGSFTIIAGSTTATMSVSVKGDTDIEPDETFFCNITKPSNASLSDNQGLATILNDDSIVVPSITVADVSAAESAGTLTFTLTLTPAAPSAGTVTVSTASDTATGGTDYVPVASTVLNFAAGATTVPVNVTLNDDSLLEPAETFFLNLTAASNAVVSDSQAVGTITNDDLGPELVVSKTAPAGVVAGTPFDYTITVTNNGGDATGVEITDDLPAGVTWLSTTPSAGGNCSGPDPVVCTFPTLAGGASASVVITVTANGSGALQNSATALAEQLDSDGSNNTGSVVVIADAVAAADVPTASTWGLLALLLGVALLAVRKL